MKEILIIDDDVYIGDMLEEILNKENYKVYRAYSGTEAMLFLSGKRVELILLDLMLPGLSGEEVLAKIKDIPVIVMSAKIDINDKVKVLLGGAADYVTKPFDTKELLARISVQLRSAKTARSPVFAFSDITLDTKLHKVIIGDSEVRLTKTEYAILKILMKENPQVITKSKLLELIYEDTPDCTESSLKVHMGNLRKKLKAASGKEYIDSIWGIGFKLKEE